MNTAVDASIWTRLRAIETVAHENVIEALRTVDLVSLVEMKLHVRRYRDLADVIQLIRYNDLNESFANRLDPSLRRFFVECVEAMRMEDAHQDCDL